MSRRENKGKEEKKVKSSEGEIDSEERKKRTTGSEEKKGKGEKE